jgi:hypothetical protein
VIFFLNPDTRFLWKEERRCWPSVLQMRPLHHRVQSQQKGVGTKRPTTQWTAMVESLLLNWILDSYIDEYEEYYYCLLGCDAV